MKSDNSIIKTIFKGLVFTDEEIKLIESLFHKVSIKKGEILIHPGDHVDSQYYILDGCLRAFHTDQLGKEYTIQFGIQDWWMSDFTAFFLEKKQYLLLKRLRTLSSMVSIEKTKNIYIIKSQR